MRQTILLFLLALLAGSAAQAQDLLTKRNGEELSVKILEITPSEVRYRRADNPDGPLISIWRSDVFMIRYANGTRENLSGAPLPATTPAAPASAATSPAAPQAAVVTPAPAAPTTAAPATAATAAAAEPTLPVISNNSPDDALLGKGVSLDGPRLGFTYLAGDRLLDKARENLPGLSPFITQFGWQFETRLFRMPNGLSALAEVVPLVGGLDQGRFIPSLSGLLGLRTGNGFEIGMGPNVTPVGTSVVFALGTSFRSNGINFPVNVAVVPGNGGARISLLLGFNARHR
ncbi:MAG: hypothetical protein M3Y54_04190 [Bacteroidota bacterium]|nr:hypothetical protein [Bacteroidota bacterium]